MILDLLDLLDLDSPGINVDGKTGYYWKKKKKCLALFPPCILAVMYYY